MVGLLLQRGAKPQGLSSLGCTTRSVARWSKDLRTVLALAFGDRAAVALQPLASLKHPHHPHWMEGGIMRTHYV